MTGLLVGAFGTLFASVYLGASSLEALQISMIGGIYGAICQIVFDRATGKGTT